MKYISIKLLKVIIPAVFFLLCNTTYAYAEEIKVTKFIPENISYTINKGQLDLNCNINDEGSYEIHGDMNTSGLEEGYYTSFIYENNNFNWSNYDGISFRIENMGEGSIDFNISILCRDEKRFTVSKENAVLIKRDNNSIIERTHLPYGAVNINKGFIGNVYIPFDSLTLQSEDNSINSEKTAMSLMDDRSNIISWGISITCRENESKHFKISDSALVDSNQNFNDYLNESSSIIGDSIITIPEVGEYIYSYELDNIKPGNESTFTISDNFDGIEISESGILTVKSNAEPQIITIDVLQKIGDNKLVGEAKTINLVRSWSHDQVYEDGVIMAIPNEDNYSMLVSSNNVFLNNMTADVIRMICIAIVCVMVGIYYIWQKSKKYRRNNKIVKEGFS